MQEDRMERRSLARPQQHDSRRSLDSTHKPWPRSNKKRELPGSTPNKNDSQRSRNAPASRGSWQGDRPPRARAQEGAMGGAESSGLADLEAELGSVFTPGPKKQNLNHLLNFSYSPRGPPERGGVRTPAMHARRSHAHPHDRDLFLQSSCQFAVKEGGKYRPHLSDPDLPVKWEQVEQIVVRVTGVLECPVCLLTPVAARITRCGHVYCWPCALHYVAVHERSPPPCPVCAAPLHAAQLKSATVQSFLPSNDEEVCMRLVRRVRGSTVVELAPERGAHPGAPSDDVPAWSEALDQQYAKLFTVTTYQVRNIIEAERKELSKQILAEIDTTEIIYIEQALDLLKKKEEELNMASAPIKEIELENTNKVDDAPTVIEKTEHMPPNKLDWFDVTGDETPASRKTILCVSKDVSKALEDLEIENGGACAMNPDAKPFVFQFTQDDGLNQNGGMNEDGGCKQDGGCGDREAAEEFPLLECSENDERREGHVLTQADKENQAKYFYFYQAEDGQHVFLHGVNVRVLCAAWSALSAAPTHIRARVLRRESFSLTQQSRKHMPCAAHLPLHCPYDVVELDLQPPYVTRQALDMFAEELERRKRARNRLEREEMRRDRAAQRAAEGFRQPRPDFSSEAQFPCYSPPSPPPPQQLACPPALPSSPSGLSFAKMAGTGGAWRVRDRPVTPPPAASPGEDEEGAAPAPRSTLNLSDAIEAALHAPAPATSKGARKKNKPKLLFSTGVQRAQ